MAQQIRDVMTRNPVTLPATATAVDAAKAMRENNVGDVIVLEDNRICGIVTDRDIVVRSVATGGDPTQTKLSEICSRELTTVSTTDDVSAAVQLMKNKAVRRLPVVDGDRPVGVISLGDLAVERDEHSALGEISVAPPNR
jgi:CBS domain-containing protein